MIHIITTGGTISGIDNDGENSVNLKSNVNIGSFLENANVSFDYKIDHIFDKDSRLINSEDLEILGNKVRSSIFDKILITHGTYTMSKTAEYIGNLNLNKTIVLVGSFILGSDQNTDAPFNIGFAISSLQFLNKGVYIVMNGEIFDWFNVYKNQKENKFKTLKK